MIKLQIYIAVIFLSSSYNKTGVYAFITSPSSITTLTSPPSLITAKQKRISHDSISSQLFAINNNDGDDGNDTDNNKINNDWVSSRLRRADFEEIQRDIILCSCFVLGRYLIYDISTGAKVVAGFDSQDIIWLSGTLSSAALLGIYWTAAGLLTRLFETTRGISSLSLMANLVNIAMCCPLWIATEHFLRFGPSDSDIGGSTLDQSIANGFLGLTIFMTGMKTITSDWR